MLLDQVRSVLRMRHYSIRNKEAYVDVVRRFILYQKNDAPERWAWMKSGNISLT